MRLSTATNPVFAYKGEVSMMVRDADERLLGNLGIMMTVHQPEGFEVAIHLFSSLRGGETLLTVTLKEQRPNTDPKTSQTTFGRLKPFGGLT